MVKASEARDEDLLKGYNESQSNRSLDVLAKGQHVYMQNAKMRKWTIIERCAHGNLYYV